MFGNSFECGCAGKATGVPEDIGRRKHVMGNVAAFGKLKLSCDVIVVDHFLIGLFCWGRAHIDVKKEAPDREAAQSHHIT